MKKKLIIIISICVVIFTILFLLFGKYIIDEEGIDIDVGGYNQVIKVLSFDEDFNIKSGKYAGEAIKIEIEIDNKKEVDCVTGLYQFNIADSNDNDVGSCYHDSILPNNELNDIFPSKILGNTKTRGSLYCYAESSDISKLKITVIAGGRIKDNGDVIYEYKDYYIDLK